uniref:Isoform 2 of Cyclin-J-like protein n=1 Tax=Homo sapiens TaxID=9606 RepID=Q8IV13-2|nr:unnamed protein product [Homo sapiens]
MRHTSKRKPQYYEAEMVLKYYKHLEEGSVSLCCPGWSAVAQSRLTAASTFGAQVILLFQLSEQLRLQELKLPTFRAHSPLLKSRRFFVDILTLLSSHCQLCPAARHLAVYLLDHFMDRYNVTTSKQLYTVAVSCLLLASRNKGSGSPVPTRSAQQCRQTWARGSPW